MTRGPDPDIQAVDILRVFLSSSDAAFVPAEIADELGVTTEGARHQMNRLTDRELLEKKKPGSRTVLYWITESGHKHYWETSQ